MRWMEYICPRSVKYVFNVRLTFFSIEIMLYSSSGFACRYCSYNVWSAIMARLLSSTRASSASMISLFCLTMEYQFCLANSETKSLLE